MRKYEDEFKREAVRKILDGQSVASVARELGVSTAQRHHWRKQKLEVATDVEREIELKRRLREVEMGRGIRHEAFGAFLSGPLKRFFTSLGEQRRYAFEKFFVIRAVSKNAR